MKYNKVVRGGQLSASQWNGFLDLHREYYSGNANNGPIPPILSKSVIASASLADGSDEIGAYQPVRIVQQVSLDGGTLNLPAYVVEAVDRTDGERHGNYAFTLGEGLTSEGGRVVVSGLALVAMDASQLQKDKADQAKEGSFDSSFYVVPDETLSPDVDNYIAPTGHFKLLSWYTAQSANDISSSDTAFVVVNMNDRPTSFIAEVDAAIDASSVASDITTMSSGTAYAFYGVANSTAAAGEIEVEKDDTAYEITVYNPYGYAASIGEQLISYSLEYNRFIVAKPQTVKIGKADAQIPIDSTGTVSIWRDGVDTTENITGVKLDWMAGTTNVSSGKEVMITWFADEGIWRITGAECEDA